MFQDVRKGCLRTGRFLLAIRGVAGPFAGTLISLLDCVQLPPSYWNTVSCFLLVVAALLDGDVLLSLDHAALLDAFSFWSSFRVLPPGPGQVLLRAISGVPSSSTCFHFAGCHLQNACSWTLLGACWTELLPCITVHTISRALPFRNSTKDGEMLSLKTIGHHV
ncbi:hypothetical protein VIGAN_UM008900 [Vigna angularis var. angularis]|nr:hypothetical protein VIGAN_UM008900 [Vigna angularis var. angularis]